MKRMGKVLLVGGNGFIGSHLIDGLLKEGYAVRVLDLYDELYRKPLQDVEYIRCDYNESDIIKKALTGCTVLIHLVHSTVPGSSLKSIDEDLFHNIIPFVRLMQSLEHSTIEKVIYFSSGGAVYGIPKRIPVDEEHPLEPISSYGVAKLTMEAYLRYYSRMKQFNYTIIRPSNPYGPRQNYLGKQGVIPIFMHKIMNEEPLRLWGSNDIIKDFIFIEDLSNAVIELLESGPDNETFNIGSGIGTSLVDLISMLEQVTGKKASIVQAGAKSTDVPYFVLNISKYNSLTSGKVTTTNLYDGLNITYDWLVAEKNNLALRRKFQ